MMNDSETVQLDQKKCPCGSNKQYAACCQRYISGNKLPPIAEALMRSRYTAFTMGNVNYILATWAADTKHNINAKTLKDSLNTTQYLGLKILSKKAGTRKNNKGQVEFEVKFKSLGRVSSHIESSNFIKTNNQWFYVDGAVSILDDT